MTLSAYTKTMISGIGVGALIIIGGFIISVFNDDIGAIFKFVGMTGIFLSIVMLVRGWALGQMTVTDTPNNDKDNNLA